MDNYNDDIFMASELADLFRYFADTTRIRILLLLCEGEMCVCDMTERLEMSQSAVSHQLNQLRKSRLVRTRREGKSVFYALGDDHVRQLLSCGKEHISE